MESEKKKKKAKEKQPEKVIEVKSVRKIYRMGKEKIYAVDDVSFAVCWVLPVLVNPLC